MPYLIDGYNLLHALGVMRPRLGPSGLEKARLRLLGRLKGAFAQDAGEVTVVFDAAGAPPGAAAQEDYEGIHVLFAVGFAQADDLIELLIRQESVPARLSVVSDDRRLREAARRRKCPAVGCLDFVEFLQRRRQQRRISPMRDEKVEAATPGEVAGWLNEFADLEQDPELREFFQRDRFEDDPRATNSD